MAGMGADAVHCSSREMCVRWGRDSCSLLQFYHEWALVTENRFILEVIWVRASLVFPIRPPLSNLCIPFLLPHEGNPKKYALMAKIWAMVNKGAVIPLPQDPGLGFYCNLFLVTKVMGGGTSL